MDLLKIDLLADPPRAAKPTSRSELRGLFWAHNGLNELAGVTTDEAFKELPDVQGAGRKG